MLSKLPNAPPFVFSAALQAAVPVFEPPPAQAAERLIGDGEGDKAADVHGDFFRPGLVRIQIRSRAVRRSPSRATARGRVIEWRGPRTIEGAIMDKPDVGPIEGAPPAELVVEDLTVGDGPEAKAGQTVDVHYVGVAHSTGQEFDASYNRGEAFSFPLGAGRVIGGWDQGVQGMKVGGRRRLTIPPHLGYGARGAAGAIKPNETLIFVVDLLGVH
jgi:peptidylprolyl isomerase